MLRREWRFRTRSQSAGRVCVSECAAPVRRDKRCRDPFFRRCVCLCVLLNCATLVLRHVSVQMRDPVVSKFRTRTTTLIEDREVLPGISVSLTLFRSYLLRTGTQSTLNILLSVLKTGYSKFMAL